MQTSGRLGSLVLTLLLITNLGWSQSGGQFGEPAHGAPHSFSFEVGARSIVQNRVYGTLGYGRLSLGLFTMEVPIARRALFSGEISAFALAGTGALYKVGRIDEPLPVRLLAEAGVTVPIFNISNLFNLRGGSVLQISPAYQYQLIRNYRTGHHIGIHGADVTLSLSLPVSQYLLLMAGVGRSIVNQPPSRFLWGTSFSTIRLGLVIRLGEYANQIRRDDATARILTEQAQRLGDAVIAARDERDSLSRQIGLVRDSTTALKADLAASMLSESALRRKLTLQSPPESLTPFDEAQKAPASIIRIDKQLFEGGDLLEEDYLKAILAIVRNAGAYVWEIQYRESPGKTQPAGKENAEKILHFFEIYDSSLEGRLRISRNDLIKTDFEIRCLGRVTDQPIASTPN